MANQPHRRPKPQQGSAAARGAGARRGSSSAGRDRTGRHGERHEGFQRRGQSDGSPRRADAGKGPGAGRADRERTGPPRPSGPPLPEDLNLGELDPTVRQDLRVLPKELADQIAGYLVMAGQLLDEDPVQALKYAQAARVRASRLAVVREAVGVAAYYAGEWQTSLSELRAARRLSGSDSYLPMIADCERALGRPEKAWSVYVDARDTVRDPAIRAELVIVAAGIRRDADDLVGALELLAPEVNAQDEAASWLARLRYAYADTLKAAGRDEEAGEWLALAAQVDERGMTDAAERLLELDGFSVTSFATEFEEEDATALAAEGQVPQSSESSAGQPANDLPSATSAPNAAAGQEQQLSTTDELPLGSESEPGSDPQSGDSHMNTAGRGDGAA